MSDSLRSSNKLRSLSLIDDQIKFTISLAEVPSPGQFRNATPEAQSLALISILKIEYSALSHCVRSLARCSRALRCTLFELKPILTAESYPALRIAGSQMEIESAVWEYARTARGLHASVQESKREIRIKLLAVQAEAEAKQAPMLAPYETPKQSSQDRAKAALSLNKKLAKNALGQILSASLCSAEPEFNLKPALLAFCKEVIKGENLATCPNALRTKASSALRLASASASASASEALEDFARILDSSFDPFLGKAQDIEALELDLDLLRKDSLRSSKPRTLAEILEARRKANAEANQNETN